MTAVRSLLEAEGRWDHVARVSVVTAQPEPEEVDAGAPELAEAAPVPDMRARRLALVLEVS